MGMFDLFRKEGREAGREERDRELLIKALKSKELPLERIANLFGIDLPTLRQLKADLDNG